MESLAFPTFFGPRVSAGKPADVRRVGRLLRALRISVPL
jgi:hypothetical protein